MESKTVYFQVDLDLAVGIELIKRIKKNQCVTNCQLVDCYFNFHLCHTPLIEILTLFTLSLTLESYTLTRANKIKSHLTQKINHCLK